MAFERLQYLVTLDPTNATAGAGKIAAAVKKSVAEADAEIAKLQRRIDQLNNKSLKLGQRGDSAGSETAFREAQGLESKLGGLKDAAASGGIAGLSATATQAAVAGVAIAGVGASLLFVKKSVGVFTDLTAEVRQFQRVSGASAGDASTLVATVKVLGIDAGAASLAMFRLGNNVDGSHDKLAALGVQVAHTANGGVDLVKTLENVGTAFRASTDASERDRIAKAAFGRGGEALIPLLSKSREELAALKDEFSKQGIIFDQKDLDRGREFTLATRELGNELKGVEVDAGRALVPYILDLASATKTTIEFVKTTKRGFDDIASFLEIDIAGGKKEYEKIKAKHDHTKATTEDTDAVRFNAQASGLLSAALGVETDATKEAAKAEKDHTAAAQGRLSAANGLLAAEDKVNSAKKAVAEAAKGEAEKTAQLADAQRLQADAASNLADKEEALRQAQKEAPRDLERAGIAARKAAEAQKAAAAELEKQHRRRPGSDKEAAAKDDLTSATLDALDAQDRLNELQAKGGAPKSVTDATKARDDALRARDDADKHIKDVQAINPYAAQVKAAQDLRDAEADRLVAVTAAKKEFGGVNAALLDGLNLATATRDQIDALVNKLKEAQALGPTINSDFGSLPGSALPGTVPGLQGQIHSDIGSLPQTGPAATSARTTINGQFTGPITVQANDPKELAAALAARVRLQNLAGGGHIE